VRRLRRASERSGPSDVSSVMAVVQWCPSSASRVKALFRFVPEVFRALAEVARR
jgi:hypothetical protein